MKVKMGRGTRLVGEGFGHVSGNTTILCRHLGCHHPKNGQAVRGLKSVGPAEVDLVLPVGVLVVAL